MNLQELIQWQLSENFLGSLGNQVGIQDEEKSIAAGNGIIQALLAGLNKNTQSEQGAQALSHALERDHDGGVLDDMFNMILQNAGTKQNKALDGSGIIGHILGGKSDNVFSGLAQSLGTDKKSVMQMAIKLAPFVMGVLGRTKKRKNLGSNDLTSLLRGAVQADNPKVRQSQSMLSQLLDTDGDGSVQDELLQHGLKLFGSFLKG